MVWAMLTIAFHMLMYFLRQPKGVFGKLFGLVPVLLVCALLVLKPVTSLMNMYYTQNAFTSKVGCHWSHLLLRQSEFEATAMKCTCPGS